MKWIYNVPMSSKFCRENKETKKSAYVNWMYVIGMWSFAYVNGGKWPIVQKVTQTN